MKRFTIALMLCILTASLAGALVDKIIAKVGTDIILMSDLEKQLINMRSTGINEELLDPLEVLGGMVEHRLMVQKARELKLSVDETAIKNYAERYIAQIRSQYDSEAAFQQDLKAMRTTQRDLLNYVISQITEQSLTELLTEKYISSKVNVSDAEISDFYEASKDSLAMKPLSWDLRMIMREVQVSDEAEAQIVKTMSSLQKRAAEGGDFEALAREYSDCPSSKQGGDLGFFKRGMMVKPFEDAAYKLEVGEISGLVKTDYGYHIIKVTDKKGDEVRASHILKMLSPSEADFERERELMDDLRQQITNGADFGELAQEYSMDLDSAEDDGLLGEFGEADFPELFAAALLNSPVGSPTEVLTNDNMLYLFMRDQEHAVRLYTLEELQAQIKSFLEQQKKIKAYEDWMDKLKAESFIQLSL